MASPHSMTFRRINCYLGSAVAAVLADLPGYRPGELPWDCRVALRGHMTMTRVTAPVIIWGCGAAGGEVFATALVDTLKTMEQKVKEACAPPAPFTMGTPRAATPEEAAAILGTVERSGLDG